MNRPRILSVAGRCRRIGPAAAALLLVLLASACVEPNVAPPSTQGQPPPSSEPPAAEDVATLAALPADEVPAQPVVREPPVDEDQPAAAPEAVPTTARVGLLLPLTGRYASEGETLLRAAQLALFDIADEHFLLLPRDTEGTAKGAERAALALLDDGVDLILGPLFAEGVSAVADHARARNVTVVAFSTDRAVASEGVYLLGHTPRAQIRRVFAHAAAAGHREIALLVPDTRYGVAVLHEAWAAAAATGLSLARARTYAPDASDAAEVVRELAEYDKRAQALEDERAALVRQNDAAARRRLGRLATLDTLGALPFDALLLADGGARLQQVAPLLPYYDIDPETIRLLGTGLWDDPVTLGEPALAGGWFAGPDTAARRHFENRYRRIFGEAPGAISTVAYDATALAAALARAGATFESEAIGNRGGFLGADGLFRFDDEGIAERGLAIFEVASGGETRIVSPAPARFAADEPGPEGG